LEGRRVVRQEVLLAVFADQLKRLGRPHARVALSTNHHVSIADTDGSWEGPAARGLSRLILGDTTNALSPRFWSSFDA
jgi:hypothetical protein